MSLTDEERVASSATASTSSASTSPPAQPPPAEKKKKKFEPIEMPTPEVLAAQEFMNNCFVKSAMSGAMGGVAGLAFGLFMSSFENAHGGMDMAVPDGAAQKPTRVVLKEMFNNMRTKSVSYAKGFAVMGALFSFNECVVEKWRAKHDAANPVIAGCVTGAMMAHSGGPQAMCFGCASFAAFSYVIEKYLQSE
ncbi:hypothetical protein HYH02_007990 [Chlamydomonas schloesseri]|uniref:Mitochondrial import inner membrane translocase subunit TIM22 n=1 Tax=Chlamydomonas schloesseri TaxID=2026947 RepID=A0A835WGZ2_9CHLO|nr:hypothetical protein HYH02_007990 [Chlamydomonas schloesseri]|eukprot:KAG2447250.1 hypothetical protein HYH02_007990 [Chlamydomonas schloesseri]